MFLTNCISSRGREMGGGGWVIYLFMGCCSFKHRNGEEERTNKCVMCLVTGRKREKERRRKREIKKFWTRFTAQDQDIWDLGSMSPIY